jgi:hypothetical protein
MGSMGLGCSFYSICIHISRHCSCRSGHGLQYRIIFFIIIARMVRMVRMEQ